MSKAAKRNDGFIRRKLLRSGAAAVPSLVFARGLGSAEAAGRGSTARKVLHPRAKAPQSYVVFTRDPLERKNLTHRGHERGPLQEREYRRLRRKPAEVEKTRLREPARRSG